MKKTRLYWIIALPFLFLLVVYILFQGIKRAEKPDLEKAAISKSDAYMTITGFTFTEYISGMKKMEVKTEKTSIRPKKIGFFKTPLIKEAHMVKPEVFFFADGKETSHIMADSGKMNMANKKMLLKGNVILITSDGKRLSTRNMAVDPKKGLLSIKGRFTLKRNGDIIKGKGLRSDIELKKPAIKIR